MKKIITLACIAFCTTTLHAQKPIELYDLIKHFIPDSLANDNYNAKAFETNYIKWLNSKSDNEKSGSVKIMVNGVNPSIDPENKITHIILNSPDKYSKIKLRCNIWNEAEYNGIASLLLNNQYQYKVYAECDSSTDLGQPKIYELKLPGKKAAWTACYYETGDTYGQLYITIYLNQNDVPKNCDDARQDIY